MDTSDLPNQGDGDATPEMYAMLAEVVERDLEEKAVLESVPARMQAMSKRPDDHESSPSAH